MLALTTHASIRDVPEATWDALAGEHAPPFLSWAWLDALERSGCAAPEAGWLPQHLVLHEGERIVAAAPAYLKGNSEGEFVFDGSWADYAGRLGVRYYPKLVVAVPFTPATGARVLVADEARRAELTRAMAVGARRVMEDAGLSSAHVLFPPAGEAAAWVDAGFAERHGIQYQWHDQGFGTWEGFLGRFDSKRRNQLRRERREPARQGVSIRVHQGKELTDEVVAAMFRFYLATVDKFVWGRRYLNRAFFDDVCTRLATRVQIVLARDAAGEPVAGAFNLVGHDALYGRYWGAARELPFLHFNVCYYEGIEWALAHGKRRFEPGAGGEHKRARGFDPTVTRSAHLLVHPRLDGAVRHFLQREREAVAREVGAPDASGRAAGG